MRHDRFHSGVGVVVDDVSVVSQTPPQCIYEVGRDPCHRQGSDVA